MSFRYICMGCAPMEGSGGHPFVLIFDNKAARPAGGLACLIIPATGPPDRAGGHFCGQGDFHAVQLHQYAVNHAAPGVGPMGAGRCHAPGCEPHLRFGFAPRRRGLNQRGINWKRCWQVPDTAVGLFDAQQQIVGFTTGVGAGFNCFAHPISNLRAV